MNNSLQIRSATLTDIETIRQMAYETWPIAYADILSPKQLNYMLELMYNHNTLAEQMQTGHQFFIAAKDNSNIGFAGCSATETTGVFKLHKLYVLPIAQKTGAGKALLKAVIQYVTAAGGKQLKLQVNRHNKAKHFYEYLGFSILYEQAFDIGEGYVMDDYVMGIDL